MLPGVHLFIFSWKQGKSKAFCWCLLPQLADFQQIGEALLNSEVGNYRLTSFELEIFQEV